MDKKRKQYIYCPNSLKMLYQFDSTKFNLPIMTTTELSKTIYDILFTPDRLNSGQLIESTLAAAKDNSVRTLWKKIQPLLGESLEDLQEYPSDPDTQASIRTKLRRTLNKNESLKTEVENLTQEVLKKEEKDASVVISDSRNVTSRSTLSAGENIHIGDTNTNHNHSTIGQQINTSGNVLDQYNIKNDANIHIGDVINIQKVMASSPTKISDTEKKLAIQEIHDLISKSRIKPALKQLLQLTKDQDTELQHQVILLTSRWNSLKMKKVGGTISSENANIAQNRIMMGILGLLEELE